MLSAYTKSQFIEQTLTDCYGRQFQAVFFVGLINGEVKGRLISIRPIGQDQLKLSGSQTDGCICLPEWTQSETIETPYLRATAPFVSPYFDIELILSNHKVRAPSLQ